MTISSINSNWLYYPYNRKNSTASTAASTTDDLSSTTGTSLDDASAQELFSGILSQGLLPVSGSSDDGTDETGSDMAMAMMMPSPPPPMDTTATTDDEDAIGAFLDKVQSGTATGTDISSMQSILAQSDSSSALTQTTSDTTDATDSTLTLQSFLAKVKAGTVTDSDLSAMQALLNTVQGQSGMMPPPPPDQADSNSVSGVNQSQLVSAIQSYENTGTVYSDNNSSWSS